MDGGATIIDNLISGQVHSVSDLEKFRIEYLKNRGSTNSIIKSAEQIDKSSLSADLKVENKAYVYWVGGQYKSVISSLKDSHNLSKIAQIVLGHSYLCNGDYHEAIQHIKANFDATNSFQVSALIDAHLGLHQIEEAEAILEKALAANASDKYIRYAKARIQEYNHELEEAIDGYQALVDVDKTFHLAAFRLANLYDLVNEDEKAVNMYLNSIPYGYSPVNTLINLGLLLEDDSHYAKAIQCFQKALDFDPTNLICKLHLNNSLGSQNMVFDERKDLEKKATEKILNVPVSDFELSVRSRNCLANMNILTLGDLVNRTEEDLLSYKNFGETSLKEIKEMLSQRSLSLKSSKEDQYKNSSGAKAEPEVVADSNAGTPIDSLQISLRSRRCLKRLDIRYLEELTKYSKDTLMAIPNFGQTSFDELSILLTQHGLSFKP